MGATAPFPPQKTYFSGISRKTLDWGGGGGGNTEGAPKKDFGAETVAAEMAAAVAMAAAINKGKSVQ